MIELLSYKMNLFKKLIKKQGRYDRKKVVIHFGYHKTGTSSIQEVMNENRSYLRDNGIFYPQSVLGYPAAQELAWSLVKTNKKVWMNFDNSYEETYKKVLHDFEESGCHTLIISSEDFTFLEKEPGQMETLKKLLTGYDIELICYVREPVSFLLSLYGHRIRVGDTTKNFEDYVEQNMNLRVGEFEKRISIWEKVFSDCKLVVANFNYKNFYNGNIANDFFNHLSIDIGITFKTIKTNESLHPWCSELVRNIYASDKVENPKAIVRQLIGLSKSLPKVSAKKYYISDGFERKLNEHYKVTVETLRNKYGINFE